MSFRSGLGNMRRAHWVWHLVLALFVLLGQVGAARHSLQHIKKADGDAAETACLTCLGLHAVDQVGAPPAGAAVALPARSGQGEPAHLAPAHWVSEAAPYQSRAPPVFSAT